LGPFLRQMPAPIRAVRVRPLPESLFSVEPYQPDAITRGLVRPVIIGEREQQSCARSPIVRPNESRLSQRVIVPADHDDALPLPRKLRDEVPHWKLTVGSCRGERILFQVVV